MADDAAASEASDVAMSARGSLGVQNEQSQGKSKRKRKKNLKFNFCAAKRGAHRDGRFDFDETPLDCSEDNVDSFINASVTSKNGSYRKPQKGSKVKKPAALSLSIVNELKDNSSYDAHADAGNNNIPNVFLPSDIFGESSKPSSPMKEVHTNLLVLGADKSATAPEIVTRLVPSKRKMLAKKDLHKGNSSKIAKHEDSFNDENASTRLSPNKKACGSSLKGGNLKENLSEHSDSETSAPADAVIRTPFKRSYFRRKDTHKTTQVQITSFFKK